MCWGKKKSHDFRRNIYIFVQNVCAIKFKVHKKTFSVDFGNFYKKSRLGDSFSRINLYIFYYFNKSWLSTAANISKISIFNGENCDGIIIIVINIIVEKSLCKRMWKHSHLRRFLLAQRTHTVWVDRKFWAVLSFQLANFFPLFSSSAAACACEKSRKIFIEVAKEKSKIRTKPTLKIIFIPWSRKSLFSHSSLTLRRTSRDRDVENCRRTVKWAL